MSLEALEDKAHKIEGRVIRLETSTAYQEERMRAYEKFTKEHMEREDARWEKIEAHMKKMNKYTYVFYGVAATLLFLWSFAKDLWRIVGG